MYIHNFFSDLLLSIRVLFDSVIFRQNFIKTYDFNISNRSFTLANVDYRPNYEFPSCIVNLNSEEYSFGERPNTIQKLKSSNFNMIPVVVDIENATKVYIQEEQCQVSLSIIINCESQLQAKETEFRLKRYLPLGKYIQLFQFTSFLEIPERELITHGIDFNTHEVANLYTRLNSNTGSVDYCYSVLYQPLIRLESSSVSISDSSQRSFPLNIELTYQIQMPMWATYDKDPGIISQINIDFTQFGNEPISENSTRPLLKDRNDKFGNISRLIKRNLLVHDLNDYEFLRNDDIDKVIFSVQFNKDDFIISPDFEFDIFDINGKFHQNIEALVDINLNKVVFEFSTDDYDKYYKASITKPIIIQFIEIRNV